MNCSQALWGGYDGGMEENAYRAPKEEGAKPDKRNRFTGRVWVAIVAAALNLVICGGWMIYRARRPGGLTRWQALPPTAMIAITFFGAAVEMWKNRPTGS
jgi:hypothetical protein